MNKAAIDKFGELTWPTCNPTEKENQGNFDAKILANAEVMYRNYKRGDFDKPCIDDDEYRLILKGQLYARDAHAQMVEQQDTPLQAAERAYIGNQISWFAMVHAAKLLIEDSTERTQYLRNLTKRVQRRVET